MKKCLTKKAREVMGNYDMLNNAETVLVGLSGGADSVALTHFLHKHTTVNTIALHLNHLLRKDESDADAKFVKEFCDFLNIPLIYKEIDVKAYAMENKLGLEEAGRILRYKYLTQTAYEIEIKRIAAIPHVRIAAIPSVRIAAIPNARIAAIPNARIALAHTLNDRVETFLLNSARGSSLSGLISLKPIRTERFITPDNKNLDFNIIRPLIGCTREMVEDYCRRNDLKYITDSTNSSREFTRNRIRLDVIPQMKKVNPAYLDNMEKLILSLERENDFSAKIANDCYDECIIINNENKTTQNIALNYNVLSKNDKAIQYRIINRWLEENKIPSNNRLIMEIANLPKDGKINVIKNGYVQNINNMILFTHDNNSLKNIHNKFNDFKFMLSIGENNTPVGNFNLSIISIKELEIDTTQAFGCRLKNINKNSLIYFFDYDIIIGNVFVRSRCASDKITIKGRNVTKTLKKLFNEHKLNLDEREQTLIISDEEKPLVIIYPNNKTDINSKVTLTENTKKVICITQPILDWDPDFTKQTANEEKRLNNIVTEMENGEYYTLSDLEG